MTSWYIRYLKGYYHHFTMSLSWRINQKSNRFQMIFSDHVACCLSGVPRSRWGSYSKCPMVLSIGSRVVGLAFQDFRAKGLRSQHVWIVDETCKCTLQRLFKTKAEVSLQSEEICKCKTSTEFADLCWPGDVSTEVSLRNFRPFTLHILFWIFGTGSSHSVLAT